ncbi:predicted protein [Naegleria gruberi]|uniref:Predicted protein n=1 Tax=Naegleria gruberi TaxID=5762 RepID=D2VXN5_NAEGR|nr:uncharacterized protein NAEGRDRAFT_73813 [Naegleria gruberi]EFC38536.1 predicted protein [Naegleria gruberi]|eukprot:XP_002671280.1 predicted protein [Naegleria gruberi strain NEG-M]
MSSDTTSLTDSYSQEQHEEFPLASLEAGEATKYVTTSKSNSKAFLLRHGKSLLRLFLFIMYFIATALITKFTLLFFVIPRVSTNMEPARDVFLENLPHASQTAFTISEILALVGIVMMLMVAFFRKRNKLAIFHRYLFIHATLLNIRTLCISVTTFSIPTSEYKENCIRLQNLSLAERLGKALNITNFGDTCGDYVFSGHATALILVFWFVWYYSHSDRWSKAVRMIFNTILFTVTFVGCFLIIVAKEHYTVDVILGVVISVMFCALYHMLLERHVQDKLLDRKLEEGVISILHYWFEIVEFDSYAKTHPF